MERILIIVLNDITVKEYYLKRYINAIRCFVAVELPFSRGRFFLGGGVTFGVQ